MARKIVEIKEIDWIGLTAYTLVLGFLVIIGITAARGDLDTMKTVASILGPFVAAVATYLFGIKKLQHIVQKLEGLKA